MLQTSVGYLGLAKSQFRERGQLIRVFQPGSYKPRYLVLGNEINTHFKHHPDDVANFLSLYQDVSAAVKDVSPANPADNVAKERETHQVETALAQRRTRDTMKAAIANATASTSWKIQS